MSRLPGWYNELLLIALSTLFVLIKLAKYWKYYQANYAPSSASINTTYSAQYLAQIQASQSKSKVYKSV